MRLRRLVVAPLGAGQLGLGGDQRALAGGLEDGGPVALEVALRRFSAAAEVSSRVNYFSISATMLCCSARGGKGKG